MSWELRKDWEADNRSLSEPYNEGYTSGYEWLDPSKHMRNGYNFLHPSEQKGYIPGGPLYHARKDRYVRNRLITDDYPARAARYWRRGWIEGINQYVNDHELDFPMISHT